MHWKVRDVTNSRQAGSKLIPVVSLSGHQMKYDSAQSRRFKSYIILRPKTVLHVYISEEFGIDRNDGSSPYDPNQNSGLQLLLRGYSMVQSPS